MSLSCLEGSRNTTPPLRSTAESLLLICILILTEYLTHIQYRRTNVVIRKELL